MRADRGEIQSLMELCEESSISPNTTMAAPGLVVCTFHGALCYANSESFLDEAVSLINSASCTPRWLVVDFDLITEIDYCGAKMLDELHDRMEKQGVTLVFASLSDEAADFLSDLDLLPAFKPDELFGSVDAVLEAYKAFNQPAHHTSRYAA